MTSDDDIRIRLAQLEHQVFKNQLRDPMFVPQRCQDCKQTFDQSQMFNLPFSNNHYWCRACVNAKQEIGKLKEEIQRLEERLAALQDHVCFEAPVWADVAERRRRKSPKSAARD